MPTYVVAMSTLHPAKLAKRGELPVSRLKTEDREHAENYLQLAIGDAQRHQSCWFGSHVMLYADGELIFHRDTLKEIGELKAVASGIR